MFLTQTGMGRDVERVTNVNAGLKYQTDPDVYDVNQNPPIPMTMDFELTIMAKYQSDLDAIISNFIVFFNPDIVIATPHPRVPDKYLKSELVWDSSVSIDYQVEISESDIEMITATSNFTLKFWLYPGEQYEGLQDKYIHVIKDIESKDYNYATETIETVITDPLTGEEVVLTGEKEVLNTSPSGAYPVPTNTEFDEYYENILAGKIKTPYFDDFQNAKDDFTFQ
jgi:hypothetical protein